MAYNHEYPYVDPNRYNADWLLNKVKELEGEMTTFEALNKITFAGEWDITEQYPAWTIVNTNNGTEGYISIQPVPAGVTIDNVDYWRSVVNYTATIADLQNRVVALEQDVAELQSRTLEGRKFLFVGDSYIAAHANTCVEYACSVLGIPTSRYVNISVSGSAISYTTAGAMVNQLINYAGSIPRNEVTDIFVIGGLNDAVQAADASGTAAIMTGMETFVDYANANYPNAEITICFAGAAKEDASLDGRTYEKRSWARMCYSKFPQSRKVKIYPDMCYCLASPVSLFQADHIHPSDAGQRSLSNALVSYILGVDYKDVTPYQLKTITGTSYAVRWQSDGDTVTMQFGAQFVFTLPAGAYNGYDDIEIATVDGIYVNRAVTIPTEMIMASVDSNSYYIPSQGRLRLEGNKLMFSAQSYNTSGIQSFTFNSGSRLVTQPCLVSFSKSLLI